MSSAAVTACALSMLNRHLKKKQQQDHVGSEGAGRSRLVALELAVAVATASAGEYPGALTVLLSNGRRSRSWLRLRCGDAGATDHCIGTVVSRCSG